MKPVVDINNNLSVKEGFQSINKEFEKNQLLVEDFKKELKKVNDYFKTKGLSEESFTKALKDLILSTDSQINNIELDLKLTDKLNRYKEFSYDINNNIEELNIFDSPNKNTIYYNVKYEYTGDNITLITVKRSIDSYKYNKTLTYDINNNLISVNIKKL